MDRLIDSYWNKLDSCSHHNKALHSDYNYYGSLNFECVIVNDIYFEVEVRDVREREIVSNHSTYPTIYSMDHINISDNIIINHNPI